MLKSPKFKNNNIYKTPKEPEDHDELVIISDDESDITNVRVDNGCLMTDENMDLVMAAYPEKVNQFMQLKESKEVKSRKNSRANSASTPDDQLSPTSRSVQLSITQFYRSSKGKPTESLKMTVRLHQKGMQVTGSFQSLPGVAYYSDSMQFRSL